MGSIKIIGLRPYGTADGKVSQKEVSFGEAKSITDLFSNLDRHVGAIPREERWNVYYTVAQCVPGRGRKLARQTVIVFDIDSIEDSDPSDVAQAAIDTLGMEWGKTGIVSSGHGVHLIIELPEAQWITDPEDFARLRPAYHIVCAKIQAALEANKLSGTVDTCPMKETQLLRLPSTDNRKPGRPVVKAMLLNG